MTGKSLGGRLGVDVPLTAFNKAEQTQQANAPAQQTGPTAQPAISPGVLGGRNKWSYVPSSKAHQPQTPFIGTHRQPAPQTQAPPTPVKVEVDLTIPVSAPSKSQAGSALETTPNLAEKLDPEIRDSIAAQTIEGQRKDAAESAQHEILDKERKADLARAEQAPHIHLPVATPGI